jgi:hypothetical protein
MRSDDCGFAQAEAGVNAAAKPANPSSQARALIAGSP